MAAQARTVLLCLAALCLPAFANVPKASLLSEKPRLGGGGFALALHRGSTAANVLIASGIAGCLCDEGRRSRSTGKERDGETGLDYFGARYFSGAQGRFTSADVPLLDQQPGDPQSWNLYSYVRNNPLIFTDPTGNDCVYVNSAGDGIGSINNQNTAKDCGKTGGYWVDGTVTNARFSHGSLILTGTTNGENRTSASYGLGQDLGMMAMQRGTQLAEPGVNLAGQGLMTFGSIAAPLPMALATCAAGECDATDMAMAMIPGSGGGKTGRKVGEKAYEAAKESVDLLRRVLKRLQDTPNKTPATKDAIAIVKGRLNQALERLKKSEPHGISGQGYR